MANTRLDFSELRITARPAGTIEFRLGLVFGLLASSVACSAISNFDNLADNSRDAGKSQDGGAGHAGGEAGGVGGSGGSHGGSGGSAGMGGAAGTAGAGGAAGTGGGAAGTGGGAAGTGGGAAGTGGGAAGTGGGAAGTGGTGIALDWVRLSGGTFPMGSPANANSNPVHDVTVPDFDMLRSEVTAEQYGRCVALGACTAPATDINCNWNDTGYEKHPVNCVNWYQATGFCTWAGGRLPSEAEWEYAARSEGQDNKFPWGDESPWCGYAVLNEGSGPGCGTGRTWQVCSKQDGNTRQGLCDMVGNVYEWVQDSYHTDYVGAPTDGTAWDAGGYGRVTRGGGYAITPKYGNFYRTYIFDIMTQKPAGGFRCARTPL